MPTNEDAQIVCASVEQAAFVFYEDGRWKPFAEDSPESRITRPDESTHVQFNHFPGQRPYAEYRGPCGRWWVRIDPVTGLPDDAPVYSPRTDTTSTLVN